MRHNPLPEERVLNLIVIRVYGIPILLQALQRTINRTRPDLAGLQRSPRGQALKDPAVRPLEPNPKPLIIQRMRHNNMVYRRL